MILVDANLLLYATITDYAQHESARAWLEERLNDRARVGIPWPSSLAFLRIVTNRRLFSRPLPIARAWELVSSWLALPNVWVPLPTERHAEVLGALLADAAGAANLVPDAHLAALAVEHGLLLCSTDRDFSRFGGLRWEDPLAR